MSNNKIIVLFFLMIGVVSALLYFGSKYISELIPDSVAVVLMILGGAIYLTGWLLTRFTRKKTYTEQSDIVLDNPMLNDIMKLIGSMVVLVGFLCWNTFFLFVNDLWGEGGISVFYAIGCSFIPFLISLFIFISTLRLKNSLYDKIIISAEQLKLPVDITDEIHVIIKDGIDEITYLQTWKKDHGQYYSASYKLIFKLNDQNEIIYNPEDLGISYDEFLDALNEKDWIVQKRFFHEGTEESGEKWLTKTEATL